MGKAKARRNTRQRQMILDALKQDLSHPTAMEVFEAVRKRLPNISLGTVYRNLERLVEDKLVRKLDSDRVGARYDAEIHPHTHIHCLSCHRVDNIDTADKDLVDARAVNIEGYEVTGFRVEFFGICPQCRKDQQSEYSHVQP